MIRLLLFIPLFTLLVGCYIPGNFDAKLEIDKQGRYVFTYKGDITSLNILRKIANSEFSSQKEFNKAIDTQLYDLTRGGGFKAAQHAYDALFKVDYEHSANIQTRDYFFIRLRNEFFAVVKIGDNDKHYKIISYPINKKQAQSLTEIGYKIESTFQLKTNALIVKHNAETITKTSDNAQLLSWNITSLLQKGVYAEIILE